MLSTIEHLPNHESLSAVSLFSNCGAGDVGYRKAGFQFEIMAELDQRRLDVCLLNHPEASGIPGDLRDTWVQVVDNYKEKKGGVPPFLLCACPPCQGMSSARGKRTDVVDDRNLLVEVVIKVACALHPMFIVVENVPAFLTRNVKKLPDNSLRTAAELLSSALNSEYEIFPIQTDLADYGVPQTRKRAFITLIRKDVDGLKLLAAHKVSPYPFPTHGHNDIDHITLRDALEDINLPVLDSQSPDQASSEIGEGLHSVPSYEADRYEMIAAIPANSGATAWDNNVCLQCQQEVLDSDVAICPNCEAVLPRPVFKKKDGSYRLIKGFRTSSYRRMNPNQPAATITTGSGHIGSHSTIHPWENRILSPLECAYLQTFPADFKWGNSEWNALDRWGTTNIRSMIGEAVPPLFTELHGRVLVGVFKGENMNDLLPSSDIRCKRARKKLGLPYFLS